MLINQSTLASLFQGFKTSFQEGFREGQPQWQRVATLVPSSTKKELYAWLGQWPRFREWIGDRQLKSLSTSKYEIENKPFETTVSVNRDDIEDDQFGIYAPMFKEMGFASKMHPDEIVFALLAAGFTSFCYDGQYFFDTDHPVGAGTASNHGGGASTPWYLLDTTRALKPLIWQKRKDYAFVAMTKDDDEATFMRKEYRYGVDARCNAGFGFWQMASASKQTLDATNYKSLRTAMKSLKSDEGRNLGIRPNLIVVPPTLEDAAKDLFVSDRLAGGATNPLKGEVEILVVPMLG